MSLIFWKFYEIGLYFNLTDVREYLNKVRIYDTFKDYNCEIRNVNGEAIGCQPLKWVSSQSQNFAPVCFKISSDFFKCATAPNIVGKINIEGHIHYGAVLVIQCELLFDNYHTIKEFIEISQPANMILQSTAKPITEKFIQIRDEVRKLLKKADFPDRPKLESSLEPWHHTWIIWDAKPNFNRSDYRFIGNEIGKNAFYSIGLTLRTDKYRELDPIAYRDQINLKNLCPYKDEFVMITHAGNVIIPGPGLLDPQSMKNLLIDTLFGPEVGNVQRFLILMHMENILNVANKFDDVVSETISSSKNLSLKDKIKIVEKSESDLNRIYLELNKDIIISKISRLLFTSTFKTSMFNEMIDKLDGFSFSKKTDDVITRIRKSLDRERNSLNTRTSTIENKFLAILNYLAVFEVVTLILALFVNDFNLGTLIGLGTVTIGFLIVLVALFLYKIQEKRIL
ncbi:MAG: hypothetical protein KGD63_12030 [Candidatus Lokiarchaeota archaeon]|nr:hypothetical protein [Candidatus Lokiarchaeota archaeon]